MDQDPRVDSRSWIKQKIKVETLCAIEIGTDLGCSDKIDKKINLFWKVGSTKFLAWH
jgi:hypothetical protein